jgi:hypothetical protein
MPSLSHPPHRVLGLDVAKATITVFCSLTQTTTTIPNTPAAIARLLAPLSDHDLCVIEPTGGYEALAIGLIAGANIPCHRADTLKIKAFNRSFGTLAKSDPIDARALALYGQERWKTLPLFSRTMKPRPSWPPLWRADRTSSPSRWPRPTERRRQGRPASSHHVPPCSSPSPVNWLPSTARSRP